MSKANIKFAKVKESGKIPTKRREDLGYDIYACFDEECLVIDVGEIAMIPTGIASAFGEEYGVILRERGSTGTKGMSLRAGELVA